MMAVFDPAGILKETPERDGSRRGAYRIVTSSKTISPENDGHQAGGLTVPGDSFSRCISSTTLSTETKSIWS